MIKIEEWKDCEEDAGFYVINDELRPPASIVGPFKTRREAEEFKANPTWRTNEDIAREVVRKNIRRF